MIFVTVGTHEQPFDRLIKKVDELKASGSIKDEVFIQTGFSTYTPTSCRSVPLLGADEMEELINSARIVITHGGPASFLAPLRKGKVPIVVPRMKAYDEHVNDHQVSFTRTVAQRQHNIILVEDISELGDTIDHYDEITSRLKAGSVCNTDHFTAELEEMVFEMFSK